MTALGEYLRDVVKLPESIAARIEANDRWAAKGSSDDTALMAHEWAGDTLTTRRCTACGLTWDESYKRPGPGHVACLRMQVR